MPITRDRIAALAASSQSREDLWVDFLRETGARDVMEIGVYRGRFAERLLRECQHISSYVMVDPWRHLDDWNKPANKPDDVFEWFYEEAMQRTEPYANKRVVLRGKTTDVVDTIPDETLDFGYIDGDHTLRGITIDLVKLYPKVRPSGWLAGDDFCPSIWQHKREFEPTLVFPLAVHFAEAVGARIYGLPYRQFLIGKTPDTGFEFLDLTGKYRHLDLKAQIQRGGEAIATRLPLGVNDCGP